MPREAQGPHRPAWREHQAAALQFLLAHPAAAAVIPGATRPSARIAEDTAALAEHIPAAFWTDLRAAGLVSPAAPLPDHA